MNIEPKTSERPRILLESTEVCHTMPTHSGVTSDHLETTKATYTAITILTALAWYNVLELNFLIFNTFKRYGGLYFWAMFVS